MLNSFLVLIFTLLISFQLSICEDCLKKHNYIRNYHRVENLRYNKTLEKYALSRAKELARTDIFEHPEESPYGENLYYSFGLPGLCKYAIGSWYNEISLYDFNNQGFSKYTGHFTQLIWKDSTDLGCARSKSKKSGKLYIVCNYYPAGNVESLFEKNVLPPRSKKLLKLV